MADIPHLSMPFRLVAGSYAVIEQDTNEEAADCVRNIMVFGKGSRPEDPDFGIEDPTFQTQPIDVDDIVTTIGEYEPRVDADVEVVDMPDGTSHVNVSIAITSAENVFEDVER